MGAPAGDGDGGRGVGKTDGLHNRAALGKADGERTVEHVSRRRGVDRLHLESGNPCRLGAHRHKGAVCPEGDDDMARPALLQHARRAWPT